MAKTYFSDAADFDSTAMLVGGHTQPKGAVGLFAALAERLTRARQRRVDSEIGRFLQAHGGQLTDDLERQISRRFGNQAGQW